MKLTEKAVQSNTHYSQMEYQYLKKDLANYENDAEKETRLSEHLCKTCFYLKNSIAGDSFTNYTCKNCEKEQYHSNTNVPRYCHECAETHHCCIRCASTL